MLAFHWILVQDHLEEGGRSAPLNDTGDLLAVLKATSFLVAPWAVGFAVWALGLYCLWHSRLRPAVLMAAIPLTSLVFDRPYWGWLAMPLCIVGIGRVLGRGTTRAASPTSPEQPHPEATAEPGAAPTAPP